MPGTQYYSEMQFAPEQRPGDAGYWYVWCASGALQVLKRLEYISYLDESPEEVYMIHFANNASARIDPGHPLWKELSEVVRAGYIVEVFKLTLSGGYVPWDGTPESLEAFDAIKIKK